MCSAPDKKSARHISSLKFGLIGLIFLAIPLHSQAQESSSQPVNAAEAVDQVGTQSEAESSNSSSAAPPYESRTLRNKMLVAATLPEESRWLDTEYGKILAIHRISEAKSTHGVLILLHAAEDPQYWPAELENLRANLPRYGWETLALALPQESHPPIPARTFLSSSSSNADETNAVQGEPSSSLTNTEASTATSSSSSSISGSSKSNISRDQLIAAYVEAAINYLTKENKHNVVILTDNSSAHYVMASLTSKIRENPNDRNTIDGPIQALVIANFQYQEPLTTPELDLIFSVEQLPVMDIFFTADYHRQLAARKRHRAVAMRQKLNDYRQLTLNNQPDATQEDYQSFFLGRVRGFIEKKAKGIELKQQTSKLDK